MNNPLSHPFQQTEEWPPNDRLLKTLLSKPLRTENMGSQNHQFRNQPEMLKPSVESKVQPLDPILATVGHHQSSNHTSTHQASSLSTRDQRSTKDQSTLQNTTHWLIRSPLWRKQPIDLKSQPQRDPLSLTANPSTWCRPCSLQKGYRWRLCLMTFARQGRSLLYRLKTLQWGWS